MEQLMEANRKARGKLNTLGKMRAMELQMEHPQLMDDTQLETTEEMRGSGMGGGEAGMKRVIGGAKTRKVKRGGAGMATLNDQLEGEGKKTRKTLKTKYGGAGMATLNDQLEGEGKCGGTNGVMTGGAKMGKDLGEQIKTLHGEGFLGDFMSGLTAVLKPIASGHKGGRKMTGAGDSISAPPSGRQVSHAMMSPAEQGLPGQALGGQDVPPGGLIPRAYGNAPQAPASFQRNTVGMGKQMMGRPGHGTLQIEAEEDLGKKTRGRPRKGGAVMKQPTMEVKGTGKRSARGQAISKLMKSKGMTLPQASKYLKEHPEAM